MFTLSPLPYAHDALEPYLSPETLDLHHGKHHQAYVDKLNQLLNGNPMADMSLEDIIIRTKASPDHKAIFNNAAQIWNHDFMWQSMTPDDPDPTAMMASLIDRDFGGFEQFAAAFIEQGKSHFGSGWLWLIVEDGALHLTTTHDADLPLAHGQKAILTCDLWEHAYYVDYQNQRADYLDFFVRHLANWTFAEQNVRAQLATA